LLDWLKGWDVKGARNRADYRAAVLVRDAEVTRRAVEIMVRGDDVYALQPLKRVPMKVSYHALGQYHLKFGSKGKPVVPIQKTSPPRVEKAEALWTVSIVNFSRLPPHRRELYDEVLTLNAENLPRRRLALAVFIGRDFRGLRELYPPDPEGTVLLQRILRDKPPKICLFVRVKKSRLAAQTITETQPGSVDSELA